ncbi:MAG: metallophosphoesterase [Methanomicrobiales archaeon]
MKRILQLIIMVTVFFLGFLALNYYIFIRMSALFGFFQINIIYSIIIIASVSYPMAMFIERNFSNIYTRIIYTLASTWMGIAFFVLFLLIAYELLNLLINLPDFYSGIVIVIVSSLLSLYSIINGFILKLNKFQLPFNGISSNIRIVQLSDIHIGSIRNSSYMEKIVEKTNELHPDIVLITGDVVDGSAKLHKKTFCAIDKIDAPVLFVIGNHEVYEGLDEVYRVLDPTKIKILRNEIFEFQGIQIIGVDYSLKKDHLNNVLKKLKIDNKAPKILMYHVPQDVDVSNKFGINLQLSGHTHKGQIFPFNLLVKLAFPYFNGLYKYKGTYIYVSAGTGTWGPPMRLGSKNEITLITLKP